MIKRILIIDDEPMILDMLKGYLRQSNFICETAQTLKEGLSKINLEPYDLIISDLHLPDSSDYDLLSYKKDHDHDFKIIYCTGDTQDDIKKDLLEKGAYSVMHKPFTLSFLKKEIGSIV